MTLRDSTRSYQEQLGTLCRTGEAPKEESLPMAEDPWRLDSSRAQVYRDLIFSTIEGTLRRAYPITATMLGEEQWLQLAHEFFAEHPSSSPLLWQMPGELLEFVSEQRGRFLAEFPDLLDLLRFEWVEIEVAMMEDLGFGSEDDNTHESVPVSASTPIKVNPHHKLLILEYPVYLPLDNPLRQRRGSYTFFVFRHEPTFEIRYMLLAPLHRTVVELLQIGPGSVNDLLEIFREAGAPVFADELLTFYELLIRDGAACCPAHIPDKQSGIGRSQSNGLRCPQSARSVCPAPSPQKQS